MTDALDRKYVLAGLFRLMVQQRPLVSYLKKYEVTPSELHKVALVVIQDLMQGREDPKGKEAVLCVERISQAHGLTKEEIDNAAWMVLRGTIADPHYNTTEQAEVALHVVEFFILPSRHESTSPHFGYVGAYDFVVEMSDPDAGDAEKDLLWSLADSSNDLSFTGQKIPINLEALVDDLRE